MLASKGNTEHHLNTTNLMSSPLMLDALERYTAEKELSLLKSIFFTTAKSPPPKWFDSYSSISSSSLFFFEISSFSKFLISASNFSILLLSNNKDFLFYKHAVAYITVVKK